MKTVDFAYDFASPNVYLAHQVIPEIAARTGATFNYIPCLIGGIFKETGNTMPLAAFKDVRNKIEYMRLEMNRFITRHKVGKFQFNPHFPINSIHQMRGALAAQDRGELAAYNEMAMRAVWEDGVNMGDKDIFAQTLSAAGFDAAAYLEAMQAPELKEKLATNTTRAVERGAFGMPTFWVGDEMFYGKERLSQLEEFLLGA